MMRDCGLCHQCFSPVKRVARNGEYCPACGHTQAPASHGFPINPFTPAADRQNKCPARSSRSADKKRKVRHDETES